MLLRLDQYDEYFEEAEEEDIGQEEVVLAVVAPQPVNIPLEMRVGPVAGSPESPSPSPSPSTPSPRVPSLPLGSPIGDAPSFMGFYTYDNTDLEQWVVDARAAREDPNLRVEGPENVHK